MKLKYNRNRLKLCRVAPYVGAWIETLIINNLKISTNVAPYVGAWIETRADET